MREGRCQPASHRWEDGEGSWRRCGDGDGEGECDGRCGCAAVLLPNNGTPAVCVCVSVSAGRQEGQGQAKAERRQKAGQPSRGLVSHSRVAVRTVLSAKPRFPRFGAQLCSSDAYLGTSLANRGVSPSQAPDTIARRRLHCCASPSQPGSRLSVRRSIGTTRGRVRSSGWAVRLQVQ